MICLRRFISAFLLGCALAAAPAMAQYGRVPESDIDPSLFQIDETTFLGAKSNGAIPFVDGGGREFLLADMLDKPLVLVLSYYTCDGTCSVINAQFRDLLAGLSRVEAGKDFRILTLSFDKNDTTESLAEFRRQLEEEGPLDPSWTFATFKNPGQIKPFTDNIGYKYFWSPRDRTFYHPGVFLFLSPEGRLIRVLYAASTETKDVELAVLDSKVGQFRPSEIVNFAVSLCYSYNYKEGKYTFNIPLFVAAGSLLVGVSLFSVFFLVCRRRRKLQEAS